MPIIQIETERRWAVRHKRSGKHLQSEQGGHYFYTPDIKRAQTAPEDRLASIYNSAYADGEEIDAVPVDFALYIKEVKE